MADINCTESWIVFFEGLIAGIIIPSVGLLISWRLGIINVKSNEKIANKEAVIKEKELSNVLLKEKRDKIEGLLQDLRKMRKEMMLIRNNQNIFNEKTIKDITIAASVQVFDMISKNIEINKKYFREENEKTRQIGDLFTISKPYLSEEVVTKLMKDLAMFSLNMYVMREWIEDVPELLVSGSVEKTTSDLKKMAKKMKRAMKEEKLAFEKFDDIRKDFDKFIGDFMVALDKEYCEVVRNIKI